MLTTAFVCLKSKSGSKLEISPEVEKENEVVANVDHTVSQGRVLAQKSSLNSEKRAIDGPFFFFSFSFKQYSSLQLYKMLFWLRTISMHRLP